MSQQPMHNDLIQNGNTTTVDNGEVKSTYINGLDQHQESNGKLKANENGYEKSVHQNGFEVPVSLNGFEEPVLQNGFEEPILQNGHEAPDLKPTQSSQNGGHYPKLNGFDSSDSPQTNLRYVAGQDSTLTSGSYYKVVTRLREAFENGKTRPYEFRKKELENFKRMIKENDEKIAQALQQDLSKCKMESFLTEIGLLITEIDYFLDHLKLWMAPEEPEKNLITIMDKVKIYNDPKGVVLIIGAWNYPINLALTPVVGAIAAGNAVIVKPSEISQATATLIADLLPKYLDQECYAVCLGGVAETTELLKEKFDHILYTGSTAVGRIVYAAAQKHLTPVTLELGGKSPCYLDESVNMAYAVRRIMWGKCINAGQTCIAPDYLLCKKGTQDKFIEEVKNVLKEWYGSSVNSSPDYCRIVSDRHLKRLENLIKDTEIAVGGDIDPNQKFIGPTILKNVSPDHPIMKEEIFGPILPIITVSDAYEAIKFIKARERPLTSYVFSQDKKIQDLFLDNVISGSAVVNDTLIQFGVHTLPFGGVGESGIGAYHGRHSFDTFTHKKSTIIKNYNSILELLASSRYPPYTDRKLSLMQALLRIRLNFGIFKYVPHVALFAIGIAAGMAINNYKIFASIMLNVIRYFIQTINLMS